jgi:predicted RNA-binding Zn-ribbon protein involved in translation (DUF1610 family)
MGYKRALELLGRDKEPVLEPELVEIAVPESVLKKVAPGEGTNGKPDSAAEASDTGQEVNSLDARLSELEKGHQQSGRDLREQLDGINSMVSELTGEVKASPAIVQGEQILQTLEEVQERLKTLEENFKASACPGCGEHMTWENMEVKELPESAFNEKVGNSPGLFDAGWGLDFSGIFGGKRVRFRECPHCGRVERLEEE